MRNKRLIILISILSFITLLIVASSVLFSVKGVYASCYNEDATELDLTIATEDICEIKKGKSIFLLKEKEIVSAVESKIKDVKVINVERKFPNRVYINYVKIYPYFAIESENGVAFVTNDGKIISVSDKQNNYVSSVVYISGNNYELREGENLFAEDGKDKETFLSVSEAMERVAKYSAAMQTFKSVDVSYTESRGITYFTTRTGTCFEIQGGKSEMLKKLRLALSVYSSSETKYMNGGTIIINSSGTKAHYDEKNRYPLDSAQV